MGPKLLATEFVVAAVRIAVENAGREFTPSYVAKATRVVRTHNEKTVVAATKTDILRI